MEKRKTGNAPFYAAMAVCLLAAGVGTWQLLRPGSVSSGGRTAAGTVSALPAQAAPPLPAAPSGGGTAGGQSETSAMVSGAADIPEEAAAPEEAASEGGAAVSGRSAVGAAQDGGGTAGGSPSGGSASNGTDDSASGNSASGGTGGSASGNSSSGGADGSSSGGSAPSGNGGSTSNGTGGSTSGGTGGSASGNSASGGTGGKTAASAARTVCSPLDGAAAAAFSMERLQYNATLGDWRTHDGLDIAADLGTAVSAACAGTVASVTEDPLMGVTVTLRHEGGYETTYAGLQETSREAGDEIPAGGVVGTVGDTAAAEAYLGPHLHFSVRQGGIPMDPEDFLSGA